MCKISLDNIWFRLNRLASKMTGRSLDRYWLSLSAADTLRPNRKPRKKEEIKTVFIPKSVEYTVGGGEKSERPIHKRFAIFQAWFQIHIRLKLWLEKSELFRTLVWIFFSSFAVPPEIFRISVHIKKLYPSLVKTEEKQMRSQIKLNQCGRDTTAFLNFSRCFLN